MPDQINEELRKEELIVISFVSGVLLTIATLAVVIFAAAKSLTSKRNGKNNGR